ncbi:MAG: hypothetical protein HY706_12895, partial [Candidatus Hydrogenedentes bacterium]|nr:hypothetical protein [Candidatus Hydrogenedentota bacterium]
MSERDTQSGAQSKTTHKRSVGKLFRPVVIDADLLKLVHTILRATSANEPAVLAAKKRIRAMGTPGTFYLFASEIRGYLEEKTRVGTEPWVYPVAGDLFLDALEASVSSLGPNLFRDHYSGMIGCYREGDNPGKAVQGAFYCVDLVFRKTVELSLATEARGGEGVGALSYLTDDDSDHRDSLTQFLKLGRQCFQDAVED